MIPFKLDSYMSNIDSSKSDITVSGAFRFNPRNGMTKSENDDIKNFSVVQGYKMYKALKPTKIVKKTMKKFK